MRFGKITLYVAVQDYQTSVETDELPPFDWHNYVIPMLEMAFDDEIQRTVVVLDALGDDMRLVPAKDGAA